MLGLKKTAKSEQKSLSESKQLPDRWSKRVDRRSFGLPSKFPLSDRLGKIIKMDRRRRPDRRIANIEVKEDNLSNGSRWFKNNN